MKINNVTEIRPDDFDKDDRKTVGQLAEILNPFMQQVVEVTDSRIDFENRVEVYKSVEMTVDSAGKPTLNNKIKVGKTGIRGIQVIAAYNLTNIALYPTQQPFMSFTQIAGGNIQVNNISGLQANNKYRLHIIVF